VQGIILDKGKVWHENIGFERSEDGAKSMAQGR